MFIHFESNIPGRLPENGRPPLIPITKIGIERREKTEKTVVEQKVVEKSC